MSIIFTQLRNALGCKEDFSQLNNDDQDNQLKDEKRKNSKAYQLVETFMVLSNMIMTYKVNKDKAALKAKFNELVAQEKIEKERRRQAELERKKKKKEQEELKRQKQKE